MQPVTGQASRAKVVRDPVRSSSIPIVREASCIAKRSHEMHASVKMDKPLILYMIFPLKNKGNLRRCVTHRISNVTLRARKLSRLVLDLTSRRHRHSEAIISRFKTMTEKR